MEINDAEGFAPLMAEPGPAPRVILADKGYNTDAILAKLNADGISAVIPPKRNRTVQRVIDGHIYALRNLVERCFSKLKHNRRLATRYAPSGHLEEHKEAQDHAGGLRVIEVMNLDLIKPRAATIMVA